MAVQYASGDKALGICDVCGWTVPYKSLSEQIFNQRNTNLKVCPACNDDDHPQLQLGKYPINDPQALYQPRPDSNVGGPSTTNSRFLFAWNPVAANIFPIRAQVGQVTASGG